MQRGPRAWHLKGPLWKAAPRPGWAEQGSFLGLGGAVSGQTDAGEAVLGGVPGAHTGLLRCPAALGPRAGVCSYFVLIFAR